MQAASDVFLGLQRPSIEAGKTRAALIRRQLNLYACYDYKDGRMQWVGCNVTQQIQGLIAGQDGGHSHSNDRPLTFHEPKQLNNTWTRNDHPLLTDGIDRLPNEPFIASASTADTGGVLMFSYALPVVSGNVHYTGTFNSPWGSHPFNFYKPIGVPGLKEIPDLPYYIKKRSADPLHADDKAYYLGSMAIEDLEKIATYYQKLTGQKLSLNDASLPKGGMFDVFGDWHLPHSSHRHGKDIDLNRHFPLPTGGEITTNCIKNKDLFKAVDRYLKKLPEVTASQHLRFTANPLAALALPATTSISKKGYNHESYKNHCPDRLAMSGLHLPR